MIENFKEIMEKVEKLMDENPNSHGFKIVEEEFKIIDKPVIAVKEEDNLSDIFTLRLEEDLDSANGIVGFLSFSSSILVSRYIIEDNFIILYKKEFLFKDGKEEPRACNIKVFTNVKNNKYLKVISEV